MPEVRQDSLGNGIASVGIGVPIQELAPDDSHTNLASNPGHKYFACTESASRFDKRNNPKIKSDLYDFIHLLV